MLTGTPLDLTPFGMILQGVGILYWLLAAGALFAAIKLPSRRRSKWLWSMLVVAMFGYPVASNGWHEYQVRSRLKASMAHFEMRCKSAGEKIYKTVDNVEGVVWMKWREEISNADNFADQFKLNDPYGQDCGGEGCILNLLRVNKGMDLNLEEAKRHANGYGFVETVDPRDGKRYRYIGIMKPGPSWTLEGIERHRKETGQDIPAYAYRFSLEREPIDHFTARYGVVWSDVSTREDREHWIAGGSLKVIDLQTKEVIAERVGYMMDRGQGSQAGFRSPWAFAKNMACPALVDDAGKRSNIGFTQRFVFKVLHPITEK